jgi:hypothetical protein
MPETAPLTVDSLVAQSALVAAKRKKAEDTQKSITALNKRVVKESAEADAEAKVYDSMKSQMDRIVAGAKGK